jgi:hypothetical protein
MRLASRKRLAKELLGSVRKEMKTPRKTKSVRVEESKQNTALHKSELRALTTAKFQSGNLLYNRNAKEDGAVRRVYENGSAIMYEVAVPKKGASWAEGYLISDWAEDVLQPSINLPLKSSTVDVGASELLY